MRFFKRAMLATICWCAAVFLGHCTVLTVAQDVIWSDAAAKLVAFTPLALTLLAGGAYALYWRLRPADVVITVTDVPTPLMAKFHKQEQRILRREQLKKQVFDLNAEIETFNAELTPDERKAWANRPGPYGK